jgi:hypothetical protein
MFHDTHVCVLCLQIHSWEVYWDEPKGSFTDLSLSTEAQVAQQSILKNIVLAAKQANVKHLMAVDTSLYSTSSKSLLPLLESSGVCFTCLQPSRDGLVNKADFTFQNGVAGNLVVVPVAAAGAIRPDAERPLSSSLPSTAIGREDLAALCVQCLLSLPWDTSRVLTVSSDGPVQLTESGYAGSRPVQRVDQQWCVNSFALENKLASLL